MAVRLFVCCSLAKLLRASRPDSNLACTDSVDALERAGAATKYRQNILCDLKDNVAVFHRVCAVMKLDLLPQVRPS
eukprot:CAMPEP_0198692884 /NCGR_PEP_ID=MMETSP1468-20131203/237734_1 /TAXON_ID=1461545 /ORGANISM="Mantoniella sp, Strain CCMP1436" /LENGTH=75 /DNA_ID=CAMNT_0044447131 /DNA_START=92 /DNA_END=316 /DNA_ORIENTATION=-